MKKIQIEGFEMYLRDEKDWGFWQNETYEIQETELIKKLVKPNWICMDIGANIGYFTILMAKQCKYVYAFEPEPSNFELLRRNIALNKLDNIDSKMEAVSDSVGVKTLYLSDLNHGMHRMYKSKHATFGTTDVNTTELDAYHYPKIDFIKIDIEGAESKALFGMLELLIKDEPIILMEFHPPSIIESGADPKGIYRILDKLDYNIYLVPWIERVIPYDELFERTNDTSGGQNILCKRTSKEQ